MKKIPILLISILIITSISYAEGISVSQSLDKSNVAYEDSVSFEIILKWDGPQSAYLFNKQLNPNVDRMKIRGFSSSVSSEIISGKEFTIKKYNYTLIPVTSGLSNIESVTLNYLKWPDSIPGELFTEAMTIDIAFPKKVEAKKENNLLWYFIIAGIIIAIVILIIILKKSKKPKEIVQSPKEIILEKLTRLKSDTSGDMKNFLSGLYGIILGYLKNEYNLEIKDFDETNFYDQLKKTKLTNQQIEKLSLWLIKAQKAKYSPVSSAPGDQIRLETEVRDFFEKM